MTVDLWTDNYKKQCFLSCTVQWVEDYSVKQNAHFCELFQPSVKSAENIKKQLITSLGNYVISNEVIRSSVVFVSDRGANIKKSLEQFNWLPCSCHVLNIILFHAFNISAEESNENSEQDDNIGCVQILLTAVKDLVTCLKRRGYASLLKSTIIQECVTRWNTKLAVLISVNKAFSKIQAILQEKIQEQRLEGIDIALMEDLIKLLMPFKHISDATEGDKYPTLHCVLLRKRKLVDHCKCSMPDSKIIQILKSWVDSLIQEKWIDYNLYKIALFLFPKFKSMSILTKAGAQDVPSVVRSILKEENFRSLVDNETNFEHCYNSQLALPCKMSKTCSGADYVLELNEYADAAPEYEIDEVEKYILVDFSGDAIANPSQKEHTGGFDILNFWKEHQIKYPKLSKLA